MIIDSVLQRLFELGFLEDVNIIDLELRKQYAIEYAKLTNGDFSSLSSSNKKYALKLAGINLQRVINSKHSGLLYCISNPAFEGYTKIGITNNIKKRLAAYQTYDPYRAYKVETYKFVFDKRLVEKTILSMFQADLDKGEWISDTSVIDYVKSLY
jgi:hypothetical protein